MQPLPTTADLRARLEALRAGLLDRCRRSVRFDRREIIAIVTLVLLVVGGASLAYARGRPTDAASLAPVEQPTGDPAVAGPPAGQIVVHVVGAVRKPGVYSLTDGARVIDAVEAAGGFTKRAARSGVNLARPLVDGEQLVIPARGAAAAGPAGAAPGVAGQAGSSRMNINLASAADLETLPGVGPVLAQRIVAYREQHGPFRSVQDLQKVSGIGPKIFESLAPVVTV